MKLNVLSNKFNLFPILVSVGVVLLTAPYLSYYRRKRQQRKIIQAGLQALGLHSSTTNIASVLSVSVDSVLIIFWNEGSLRNLVLPERPNPKSNIVHAFIKSFAALKTAAPAKPRFIWRQDIISFKDGGSIYAVKKLMKTAVPWAFTHSQAAVDAMNAAGVVPVRQVNLVARTIRINKINGMPEVEEYEFFYC